MISLEARIALMVQLGKYLSANTPEWQHATEMAIAANQWFTPAHIAMATENIVEGFLQEDKLTTWAQQYTMPAQPKTVGIVMAGNIPLVGFHDFLCGFISGHKLMLKLSSKDTVLLTHIINKLAEWQPETRETITIADMLKGCDAYIATGSNNTTRYFEQYFAKYPHIIRKNRTSVAVLDGSETPGELALLADDVFAHFGLGCRNVTQVCVPEGYEFGGLLDAFKKYEEYIHHNKYKNNYDYHLALYLLNRVPYMTNDSVLMVENSLAFSAVGVVHYKFYESKKALIHSLQESDDIQAIIGKGLIPFGTAQQPALSDYADGVDTMQFLCSL